MTGPAKSTAKQPAEPVADGTLTSGTRSSISDANPERAALTAQLLDRLATQLGIPLTDTQVRVDAEAARRTGPRGARGLVSGGVIWLHPNGYDPRTAAGRALLAHEATHVAQHTAAPKPGTIGEAEAEAARAAADFAEGRELVRPTIALPHGVAAADTGVATTLPDSPPTAPVPTVKEAYGRDIVEIQRLLSTGFFDGIDAGEISTVLLLLDQYDIGTATAIMRETGLTDRLVAFTDDGHRRRHRRSVLASYGAMTAAERKRLNHHLFDGMSLADLPPAEHATVIEIMRDLSDTTLRDLVDSPTRSAVLTLMQTPVDGQAERDQAALRARVEARPVPDNTQALRTTITTVAGLLASTDAARARAALDELRKLLRGPAPAGQRAPTARPRSPELTFVVAALENGGAIQRLIDALPEAERAEGNSHGDVLLEVIRHRPVTANLAALHELLSFGFFDWLFGRRAGNAWLAYQIVRRLPPEDQERWRRLDNGKWYRRLEDNIPEAKRDGYEGVLVERDKHGKLVDVASRLADTLTGPDGRETWARVLAECRKGVNETRAPMLLAMIDSAGQELRDETRRAELRRAIVVRLDNIGLLDRIFAVLPSPWLFDLDHLNLLRAVAALRDPEQLRRQVYDLIKRNSWRQIPVFGFLFAEFSVSAHEAFLAFQFARLLPPTDRAELEAGGQWGAMLDAMTPEMRHASGAHLFTDRGGQERERVVERLQDNRLWQADRAAELRTLVRMAVELGQRRFVFDRSRDTRAFEKPALKPMVERFGLYAEPGRTTYQPERVPVPQQPEDLWGFVRHAAGWLWVKLRALASILGSTRLGVNGVGAEDLDLNEVQRLLGGQLGPAMLAEPTGTAADTGAPDRTGGGTAQTRGRTAPNRLTLLYNPRDGVLWFELPTLEIASLNRLTAGLGIKAGKITIKGLRAWATFPAQRLDQPAAVRLTLPEADLEDLLVTGDDLLVGVAKVALKQLNLHMSRTGVEEPVPGPPGSDYDLPIAVLGPLISFVVDVVRRASYYGRTSRAAAQLQGLQAVVDSVELEGVAYGSGITARSARIENVFAGIGLNKTAYLRALREVLQRRLARAVTRGGDPRARTDLEQRIADTDTALAKLADRDRRLAELHAKYVRDPASLGDAERREAAALERELAGGAVLDIGRLEVEGLGGDVQLDKIAVTGISGDVASPLFGPGTSSVFVTDEERIAEFRRDGPRRPPGVTGPVPMPVRAEETVVTGAAYVGEIPTSTSLAKQLKDLPSTTPLENRQRLTDLIAGVVRYEALNARASGQTPPPLTEDDRRELTLLRERLRFAFGFRAKQVRVEGIGADLLFGPTLGQVALSGGGAESFTATDVTYGGYFRAAELTGRGLGATLRSTPEQQNAEFHADELRARGVVVDWAGNRIENIGITGLVGEVETRRPAPGQPPTSYRIPNLTATSATVAGIDYRTPTVWVHSTGVAQVTGISLAAELNRTADGATAAVHRLHLDRVSAERLIAERNGPGTPFRAEVVSGALLNIDVQGLVVAMPTGREPEVSLGRFELGGIDQLKFSVAMGALGGGSGVLSSVTETGAPRRTGLLVVQSVADAPQGGEQIDLNGLQLTGDVRTPNGRVVIRKLGLGASVHHAGDTWTVRNFTVPELRLGALRWRTADGAEITSTGGAALTGLSAHGSITTPANKPPSVHVDEVRIRAITADNLRYRQDPIDITVGPRSPATRLGRPPLEIRDIRLRDLDWTSARPVSTGTLDVASASVEFGGQLAEHLKADATLSLTSLHASFVAGGRIMLRARGSADANVEWAEVTGGTPSKELSAHVAVNELDTGIVAIGGNAIEFGPGTEPGLQIADVTVDKIDYRSADLAVKSMPGGKGAIVRRPHAKLRIDLRDEAERKKAGAGASAIRRILLREIGIDAVELDGVHVTLPNLVPPDPAGAARPVELWLPPGEVAVLRNISLKLPAEGTELAAPASPTGTWTIPDLNLQLAPNGPVPSGAGQPAVLIPQLRARVAGMLDSASVRVETERVEVGILSGGGITVDLRRPSVTAIEAILTRTPDHSLRIRGLGPLERPEQGGVRAERVQLDSRTGKLTVNQLGANRLSYRNADAGLEVEVDKATVPGDIQATLPGPGRALSGTVPKLDIEGASFRVDFTAGTPAPAGPASAAPWTDLLTRLGPYEQVFDSMQGRLQLTLHQTKTGWFRTDTPLDLRITNGRLNYNTLQVQLIAGWLGLVHFDLQPKTSELRLVVDIPQGNSEGDIESSVLVPVIVWRLPAGELVEADKAEQIRIWRLLNIDGWLRTKLDTPSTPGASPSTGPSPVELRNIDLDLALRSAAPLPIDLARASRGKIGGTVTLDRNALSDLRLIGNLPGVLRQGPTGLAQAKVASTEITFGASRVGTGAITVTDLADLQFTMSPSWDPQLLTGRIRRATAENITWRVP